MSVCVVALLESAVGHPRLANVRRPAPGANPEGEGDVSAFLYGRMMSHSAPTMLRSVASQSSLQPHEQSAVKQAADDNKLVASLAALVPAEILGAHAIVLTVTTATDAAGTTSMTHPDVLKWAFFLLLGATAAVYLIGRGIPRTWNGTEVLRLLLPCVAFVVWTALLGTSALSPWIPAGFSHAALVAGAAVVAVVVIALSTKLQPDS